MLLYGAESWTLNQCSGKEVECTAPNVNEAVAVYPQYAEQVTNAGVFRRTDQRPLSPSL